MLSVNKIVITGQLARNPEAATLASKGGTLCKLLVAVDRNPKSATDVPGCDLLEIQVWNALAQTCCRDLKKGDEVAVEGRVNVAEWHDPASGELRKKTVINAGSVQYSRSPKGRPSSKNTVRQ